MPPAIRKFVNRPADPNRAFTLIELLVVIAILAILAALLSPGLRSAKDTSQRVKCVSNLRQVSLAISLYADDNDGWAPDDATDYYSIGFNYTGWANLLAIKGYVPGGQKSNLQPPRDIFVCPSQKNPELQWGLPGDGCGQVVGTTFSVNGGNYWFSTHYGMNNFFCQTSPAFPKERLAGSKTPAKRFLVGDVSDRAGGVTKYLGVSWPDLMLRHNRNTLCNMVFADGHVEALVVRNYEDAYWTDNW
ncbi:MAG: prepilin-type N-terminal cleavage/methylation domain-containing protein [Verrucomicrobia bacterium]|nr:prepilin-type N-terminal cleavage/methylation domain-containing protein [Verrucomicrobiota bacterium]